MADSKSSVIKGGTVDKTPPADLFRSLYQDRATASVLISRQGEERTFWFDRGQLLSAASNREAQQVGELLRLFGLASDTVLFAAFERALAEPGRGLAKALSETGAIQQYVADACVRALAERILYDTMTWREGAFTITPLDAPPELPVRFDKTNASLLLEGLRRLADQIPVPGPKMDPESWPTLHSDLLLRYQHVQLSPGEADVLGRIDGQRRAEELTLDHRLLQRLSAVGLVQPNRTEVDRGAQGPTGLVYLNVEISGVPPSPRAAEQMETQARLVAGTYRRLDWANLYDVLGAERTAPPDQLHRALHERARLFHPDAHLRPMLGDQREALESLFKRIRRADVTFRSKESRAAYDQTLESDAGQVVALVSDGGQTEVQQKMARANYQRARELFELEDYWPAFEMVKQSVEFDPGKPEYWILLSRIQRKNPKWVRQATDTMRRAAEKMPMNTEIWFELAEACAAERNEPERTKALKEILKLDPGNRRAQSALAEIASGKPGR